MLLALMTLVGLTLSLMPGPRVSAAAGGQPAFQGTDYPVGGETATAESGDATPTTSGYVPPEERTPGTPTSEASTPNPTSRAASATPPTILPNTATASATLPPNVFLTENAEMNGALGTPPPSETPGPTRTSAPSQTLAATPTPRAAAAGKGGLEVDWGLFWVGFSLPVLIGCGVVLYLLDHKPGLFR